MIVPHNGICYFHSVKLKTNFWLPFVPQLLHSCHTVIPHINQFHTLELWKMDKIVEHVFPQFLHSIYTDGPHFLRTVEYINFSPVFQFWQKWPIVFQFDEQKSLAGV